MSDRETTKDGFADELQRLKKELHFEDETEKKPRTITAQNEEESGASKTGRSDDSSLSRELLTNTSHPQEQQLSFVRKDQPEPKYDPSKNLKNPTFNIKETRQRDVLRALGNVGVLRISDAYDRFKYEHVKRLEMGGFIKRQTTLARGKPQSYFILNNRGKDYVRRYLIHESLYRRNPAQLAHDLALSDQYMSLSRNEQMRWMNDAEVKIYLDEKGAENYELIDGAYMDDSGEMVGVEVLTRNYSNEVAAGKIRTITEHFQGMKISNA